MTIGIIGSGALGSNVARALAKKGIAATISTRRGPESLAALVAELGGSIKAGTVAEAPRPTSCSSPCAGPTWAPH